MARALQRRIIYHAGPTNSGKTYAALQVRLLPHSSAPAQAEAGADCSCAGAGHAGRQ